MSRVMQPNPSPVLGAGRRQRSTVSVSRRLFGLLGVWSGRLRSRTRLSQLDPHMLKDIGITEAEARTEANRPFWHG